MKVALLVGRGGDDYYELCLLSGLLSSGLQVDYLAGDSVKDAPILQHDRVTFYNLRGSVDPGVPITEKILRVLKYYGKLLRYAAATDAKVFHILWLNRFIYLDRTLLTLYYKSLGKRLVFTAHNVNAGSRDGTDSLLNRLTLRFMYRRLDHIIVHTEKMKQQLLEEFGVRESNVTVLPCGINDMVSATDMTRAEARSRIGLKESEKVALFFGVITPYKGLEVLLGAMAGLESGHDPVKLIITGKVDRGCEAYGNELRVLIEEQGLQDRVVDRIGFIPDSDVEIYFKAADLLVLPYRYIYQSGVLFLALRFGLPVIASDVGSLRDYVTQDRTGFVFRPGDADDLARTIGRYFDSTLYQDLERTREEIIRYAKREYSWDAIGRKTAAVYGSLL
jgi:glycosyltransferase involved in cell wall biosynthesis